MSTSIQLSGRRFTLADLYEVALVDGVTLDYALPDGVEASDAAAAAAVSVIDETAAATDETTTVSSNVPETLAVLTLQALRLEKSATGDSKKNIYQLVKQINDVKKSGTAPASSINNANSSSTIAVDCLNVARAVRLARASLPVAILTLEASGNSASNNNNYNDFADSPHRSIAEAAAVIRVMVNGSKFKKEGEDSISKELTEIPQIQGPALDDITAASLRLELEINTTTSSSPAAYDYNESLVESSCLQVARGVQVLRDASLKRRQQGVGDSAAAAVKPDSSNETVVKLSTSLVNDLEQALTDEVDAAVAIIKSEIEKATEQARVKDQAKAARASQQQQSTTADDDDFTGMTDAQIAKIKKKRAEKEAKRKKAAANTTTVSLFGAGTMPLVEIYQEHGSKLTPGCIQSWQSQVVDKLLSGGVQRKPKIPKGTRDYMPEQMMIRQQAFTIIRRVFESHGAVEIDTPVFELKDTLTGKYGEDSKLIYDLKDQGGELLALRYDLTVPFARFLALNSVGNIKRFHIGKVYRRDQPALARGRYREFYQCDFDIAGVYGRMIPDSECVCVACEILDFLPIGDFGIKLNHRRLLDAILDICGVPADKFRTICSAIDKLDKEPWSQVKREMTQDKGLTEDVADKIGEFVLEKGEPWAMYNKLMDANKFGNHKGALDAMEDLRIMFEYLEAMEKLQFISFDLSLARGLDYYTGVIYEAVCMSSNNTQVGSIGGGGRYDNLVSMFQEAGKQTPCVGVSVGIERVFTLMEARLREQHGGSIKQPNVDVLIAAAGTGSMVKEKMTIARRLWKSNIKAEFSQQENAKLKKELQNALDREIPFMVIVGEDELAQGLCVVKDIKAKTEDKVPVEELASFLRQKGVVPVGCEFAVELEGEIK